MTEYVELITLNPWFAFITGCLTIISFFLGFHTHKWHINRSIKKKIKVKTGDNSSIKINQNN